MTTLQDSFSPASLAQFQSELDWKNHIRLPGLCSPSSSAHILTSPAYTWIFDFWFLFGVFCRCFGSFWLVVFSFILVSGWVQPHLMPLKLASHWQPFPPSAPVPAWAWCTSASRSEGAVIDGRAGGSGWYRQELTVLNWSWGAES